MLLPPDLRDWISDKHIVHFLIDAVDRLPADNSRFDRRGTGDEQYPPRMMLRYVTGRFFSCVIEDVSWSDVVVRYTCGGDLHSDHDTIGTFRRTNRALLKGPLYGLCSWRKKTEIVAKICGGHVAFSHELFASQGSLVVERGMRWSFN